MKNTLLMLVAAFSTVALAADNYPRVPYPENVRSWRHIKSMVINPGHPLYADFGGIHHIYANEPAVKGYRSGKFPDGSRIAFELFEARTQGKTIVEGKNKFLAVMEKDRAKYPKTGGWGFEAFKNYDPQMRVVGGNAAKACFGCHAQQKQSGYVFSKMRD